MRYFDIKPPQNKKTSSKKNYKKSNKKPKGSPIIFFVFFLLIMFIVFFSYQNSNNTGYQTKETEELQSTNPIETLATTQTSTTQTTKTQINPSKTQDTEKEGEKVEKQIDITILNGSSQESAASNAQQILEENGFTINQIGDAQNQYSDTVIYYTEDNEFKAKEINEALVNYKPILEIDEILVDTNNILIVIGSQ